MHSIMEPMRSQLFESAGSLMLWRVLHCVEADLCEKLCFLSQQYIKNENVTQAARKAAAENEY